VDQFSFLTTRIANYRARPSASGGVSQAINGCAAQYSRKLLTLRAKNCSSFALITKYHFSVTASECF